MKFKVKVYVSIKESVLDPQGKTVNEALHHMNYNQIDHVRIGKYITFDIEAVDEKAASIVVEEVSRKVLTNPIIEAFTFDIEG